MTKGLSCAKGLVVLPYLNFAMHFLRAVLLSLWGAHFLLHSSRTSRSTFPSHNPFWANFLMHALLNTPSVPAHSLLHSSRTAGATCPSHTPSFNGGQSIAFLALSVTTLEQVSRFQHFLAASIAGCMAGRYASLHLGISPFVIRDSQPSCSAALKSSML